MFIYTVHERIKHPTFITGLTRSLNKLQEHNPGWEYRFVDHRNAHLIVLDFTECVSLLQLSAEEYGFISEPQRGRVLVMLTAHQQSVAHELMKSYTCSILCVHERQVRLREVVECSLKLQRYFSPFYQKLSMDMTFHTVTQSFTKAEKKIIHGLLCGKSGVKMSYDMHRSQKTISTHKRNIMRKLGAKNELELHKAVRSIPLGTMDKD